MQGLAASFTSRLNLGATYSTIAFLELAGGIVGGLAFAGLFELGSHIGGEAGWGLGLPFWMSAVRTTCIPFLYFFPEILGILIHKQLTLINMRFRVF